MRKSGSGKLSVNQRKTEKSGLFTARKKPAAHTYLDRTKSNTKYNTKLK